MSISTQLLENFNLPAEIISLCDKYHIKYWSARFTYTQLLKNVRIIKDGIPFVPIFQDGLTELHLQTHPDETVRLSFRKLKYHRVGYVLIRPTHKQLAPQTNGVSV